VKLLSSDEAHGSETRDYSIFGIGVDRKHILKWLFPQEKATFHGSKKVYMYSENALVSVAVAKGIKNRERLWSRR
jgi:thermostable 8-oxoguanine DNA glycosylase